LAAHAAGDELGGIAITAILTVLLSPIAWIHHFVWFVPVLGALVADGRDRRRVVATVAIAVVLLLRLPWWGWAMLDGGPLLAWLGILLHNAYALLAIGLVLGYPVRASVSAAAPVDAAPVAS
jgi:alpha-1,2-mannosyltransferase